MNLHKKARLTFVRRQDFVRDMIDHQLPPDAAGAKHGVGAPTARKWPRRFLVQGDADLHMKVQ